MPTEERKQAKRASLAAVTEMMTAAGVPPPQDLPRLLEGGTSAGEQLLLAVPGSPAFLPRDDGTLDVLSAAGTRAVSDDGGRTLDPQPGFQLPAPPTTQADPVMGGHAGYNSAAGFVRMPDGSIGMTWTQTYPVGGNQDAFRFWFRRSFDNGATWSEDVRVNLGEDKGAPLFGTLRRLDSGRLIQPVRWLHWAGPKHRVCSLATVDGEVLEHEGHGHHPEFETAYCYYSDDDGQTWSRSIGDIIGWFQDGWGNFLTIDEPAVEQLADGRVLMIARSLIGRLLRAFSEDGGTTWGLPEITHIAADGAPCMVRRLPNDDLLCVWNQQNNNEIRRGLRRCRLTAAVTRDGQHWNHFRSIEWHPHVPECSHYMEPEEKIQLTRALDDVGPLPEGYGSSSYPTVDVTGEEVIIAYGHTLGRHPDSTIGALKYRILPLDWFYEYP